MTRGVKALVGAGIAIVGAGVAVWVLLQPPSSHNPELAEFLRAKRLADFCAMHNDAFVFRVIPRHVRLKYTIKLSMKSEAKKLELYRSGRLAGVTFYAPGLPERKAQLNRTQLEVVNGRHFVEVESSDEDSVSIRCLPEDLPSLQARFCYITNYVPRAPLTRLAGFAAEDETCQLPDGSVVDLAGLQKWLNESTAAGWKVGIGRVYQERGFHGLIVKRQGP